MGKPHGLRGEVTVLSLSDDPRRFRPGSHMHDGEAVRVVASSRVVDSTLLVRFEGVDGREAAEVLRGRELTIDAGDRRALGDGEFWPDDLVGLEARLPGGAVVGTVAGFVEGVAQGRLVVDMPAGRVEVPFVEEIVPEVDVPGSFLVIDPPGGLLDP